MLWGWYIVNWSLIFWRCFSPGSFPNFPFHALWESYLFLLSLTSLTALSTSTRGAMWIHLSHNITQPLSTNLSVIMSPDCSRTVCGIRILAHFSCPRSVISLLCTSTSLAIQRQWHQLWIWAMHCLVLAKSSVIIGLNLQSNFTAVPWWSLHDERGHPSVICEVGLGLLPAAIGHCKDHLFVLQVGPIATFEFQLQQCRKQKIGGLGSENLPHSRRLSPPLCKGILSVAFLTPPMPFMQKPSHLAKLCTYSVVTPLDYLLVETSKERLG